MPGDDGLPARKVHLHSADKAHHARYYADIVGMAMQSAYPGPLAWVELFAGPGRLWVVEEDRFRAGSAVEALDEVRQRFDYYVFSDKDPECVRSLEARVAGEPFVYVRQGDANSLELWDEIASIVPRNSLLVLYADPQGLDLHFETIQYFAELYKHCDLLLNFPVRGVIRALRAGAEAKAARLLGHERPIDLISKSGKQDWGPSIRDHYERRLRALGYEHFKAEVIRSHSRNSPLYDLMIASRNEKAIEFFREAMKRPPTGQRSLDIR